MFNKKGICSFCLQPVRVIPNGIAAIVCEHKLETDNTSQLHNLLDPHDPNNFTIAAHQFGEHVCFGTHCTPDQVF